MSPPNPSKKKSAKQPSTRPDKTAPPVEQVETLRSLVIELNHLRQLFRDTLQEYGLAVETEIAQMTTPIREAIDESGEAMTPQQQKILHQMITLIRKTNVRPEKGRRKDLKKIEETVAQLTLMAEKWQWSD